MDNSVLAAVPARPVTPSIPKPPTGGLMGQLESDHGSQQAELKNLTDQYIKDRDVMMKDTGQMPKRTPDDPMQAFSSVGAMIGVFGSLLTKRPLTAALTSIAAAQKAQHTGNLEEYQSRVAEWEMHNKYINNIQTAISSNVKSIMDNNKTTWNEKLALLKMEVSNNAANSRMFMQGEAMTMRWAQMQLSLGEFMQRQQGQQAEHNSTLFTSLLAKYNPTDYPSFIEKFQALPPGASQTDVLGIFTGKAGKQSASAAGAADASQLVTEANAAFDNGKSWTHGGYTFTPEDRKALNNPAVITSPKLQALGDIFKRASKGPSSTPPVAKTDESGGPSEAIMQVLRAANPGLADADLIAGYNQHKE